MKDRALTAPEWLARSAVYQINPRTFSAEGTLNAVTREIPALHAMGFRVLYLCPIFEADTSDDIAFWSDRQRKSQTMNPKNPYRMRDYFAIDEEYGDMDDLRQLIQAAHNRDMRVVLDLVYLHIGPNAPVIAQHPEFAKQDAEGNIQYSQWRFPSLDFRSPGLREYLYANMCYYIGVLDVDGFRCDVGDGVPLDFWTEGRARIQRIKPDAVLINEGRRGDSLRLAFDALYSFDWHETLYHILAGEVSASTLISAWRNEEKPEWLLPPGGLALRDMDNHDTVTDWPMRAETLVGHAGMDLVQVLNYAIDGIPMVYCGNELGDETELNMFANRYHPGRFHATDRSAAAQPYAVQRTTLMHRLNQWKRESDVLRYGETQWIGNDMPEQVICFRRVWQGKQIFMMANLSAISCLVTPQEAPKGSVLFESGCREENGVFRLASWGYIIFSQEDRKE